MTDSELELLMQHNKNRIDLDFPFTCKEVKEGIKKLKLQKQCGIDLISNEMVKYGGATLVLPLVKLFLI